MIKMRTHTVAYLKILKARTSNISHDFWWIKAVSGLSCYSSLWWQNLKCEFKSVNQSTEACVKVTALSIDMNTTFSSPFLAFQRPPFCHSLINLRMYSKEEACSFFQACSRFLLMNTDLKRTLIQQQKRTTWKGSSLFRLSSPLLCFHWLPRNLFPLQAFHLCQCVCN